MPEQSELVLFALDLTQGRPAAGLRVVVFRERRNAGFDQVHAGETGSDGCLRVAVPAQPGTCRFRLECRAGDYFSTAVKPTFPLICMEFLWDGCEKLVLPLQFSPHAYTTYRGS